jgi:hypothetical protein
MRIVKVTDAIIPIEGNQKFPVSHREVSRHRGFLEEILTCRDV